MLPEEYWRRCAFRFAPPPVHPICSHTLLSCDLWRDPLFAAVTYLDSGAKALYRFQSRGMFSFTISEILPTSFKRFVYPRVALISPPEGAFDQSQSLEDAVYKASGESTASDVLNIS